jgi:hypothetical protein
VKTFDAAPADLSEGEYEGLIEEVAEKIKCRRAAYDSFSLKMLC